MKASAPAGVDDPFIRYLKLSIWAYFLLLIFEGALRKWFLPSLATPLLVCRDPIAMAAVGVAFYRGILPLNPYVIVMAAIGIIGTYTAIYLGHGSFAVAVYGARILLFHFPMMFVIAMVFRRSDIILMGKVILLLTIMMAVLIGLQFFSPQTAWVNRGVGGDTQGAGFAGAMGFMRPPGTFSFTSGNTAFFSFAAPFIFYFWMNLGKVSKPLLLAATVALMAAVPLSISRGLFFQIMLCLVFTAVAISRRPRFIGPFILGIIGVAVGLWILGATPFFDTATEAFTARFESAGKTEGGLKGTLGDRFLGGLVEAIGGSLDNQFFGVGQGMGTNVGAMILNGEEAFLVSEGEWGRIVGELGPILGLTLVGCRLVLAADVTIQSYGRLVKGDLLPWLLLSCGLITLAQGGWSQPTNLGFSTMIGGLLLASLNVPMAKPRRAPRKRRRAAVVEPKAPLVTPAS